MGQIVGATEELIFDAKEGNAGNPIATLMVRCLTDGANHCRVRVEGLHSNVADTGVRILMGEREYFRYGTNGIYRVYAQGVGGDASIDWAPVAST